MTSHTFHLQIRLSLLDMGERKNNALYNKEVKFLLCTVFDFTRFKTLQDVNLLFRNIIQY